MNQSKMFAEVIVQNQKRVNFQYTNPDQGVVLMSKYLLQALREAEQKVGHIQFEINQQNSRVIEIELLEDEINKIYEVSAKLNHLQLNIVNLKRTVGKSNQQRLSALIQEKIMK